MHHGHENPWQGQEFVEDWSVPNSGIGRNLYSRPLHWEYFYDDWGRAMVRLYRVLGSLRGRLRSLSSQGFFYYYDDPRHRAQGVIAYRRQVSAEGEAAAEDVIVLINFAAVAASVWVQFPQAGAWTEQIDAGAAGAIGPTNVAAAGDWHEVPIASNYGAVYLLS